MSSRITKAILTYGIGIAIIVGFFTVLNQQAKDHIRAVHIAKIAVGLVAATFFFYEQRRKEVVRPVSERWKKFIGITLGVVSIALYFNSFQLGYNKWYHRHDQYHYYIGSKYFNELSYSRIYKCTVIAQDELGVVDWDIGNGKTRKLDLRSEIRHPDRVLRDLGNTNLLMSVKSVIADPEQCTKHFSPERWEAFKEDIKFFRIESGKPYWEGMQKDHGYNPPPVWTLAGYYLGKLGPASVEMQIALGAIDIVYMLGMLGLLYWAFGWRVFSVAAILWGCEGAGDPYYWTGGAYLRQDWLFFAVAAVCFARKQYWKLSAASMVYAGLLRIFPGLMVIGWLVVAGAHIVKHKRMAKHHLQMLLGGTLAAAVLIGASVGVLGAESYTKFYEHTIEVHDRTPLTNHMGFRVLVAHNPTTGKESGRMKYVRDNSLTDPFKIWKDMRNERYDKYRYVAWAIRFVLLGAFIYVVRRVKHMWIAQGLAIVWVIMLSQLTNYYYGFVVCAVPLILVRRNLELAFYAYVVLTQVAFLNMPWNDDKYALLTFLTLVLSLALLCSVWPPRKIAAALKSKRKKPPYREKPSPAS